MRPFSFNPHDIDANLALDMASSLGASPLHVSPVYSQPNVNPNPANYQAGQFAPNLEANHTPEDSPNPSVTLLNHSVSHPHPPTGLMELSPHPLPARQSELQSHYFNDTYKRMQQNPLPTSTRHKPSGDNGHERDIARKKPLVDLT